MINFTPFLLITSIVLGITLYIVNGKYTRVVEENKQMVIDLKTNETTINRLNMEILTTPLIISAQCEDRIELVNTKSDIRDKVNKLRIEESRNGDEQVSKPMGVDSRLSDDVIRLLNDAYNGL